MKSGTSLHRHTTPILYSICTQDCYVCTFRKVDLVPNMMPPVCRASKSSAFDIPNSLLNLLIACHAADHGDFNPGMLRDAQVFFERARILDPDNEFAASWIEKVSRILSFAVITTLMKTILFSSRPCHSNKVVVHGTPQTRTRNLKRSKATMLSRETNVCADEQNRLQEINIQ